jgi:hypothetical protein
MAVLTEVPAPGAVKPQRFPLRRERDLAIRAAVRFFSLEAILLPFVLLFSPRHFVAFGFAASIMLSAWNTSLYLLSDMGKLMHVQDLRDEQAKKDHDTP